MELSQQEKGHGGGGATISSERDWAGLGTEMLVVRLETQVGEGSQDQTGRLGTKHAAVVSMCKLQENADQTRGKDEQVSGFLISKRG